jgi:hypothetical protein
MGHKPAPGADMVPESEATMLEERSFGMGVAPGMPLHRLQKVVVADMLHQMEHTTAEQLEIVVAEGSKKLDSKERLANRLGIALKLVLEP